MERSSLGLKNGVTRLNPFSAPINTCVSSVLSPPAPVPIQTPARAGLTSVCPDHEGAVQQQQTPICEKRLMRRILFGSKKLEASKSLTSNLSPVAAGPCRPFQNASLPMPHTETTPMPVITTRRESGLLDKDSAHHFNRASRSRPVTKLNACSTVSTPSSSDSSTVMSKVSSSNAITNSTRSRESALRSVEKLAFMVTLSAGTFNTSVAHC